MWQWLLLAVVVTIVLVWLYRGPGILTPVPEHAAAVGTRPRGDPVWVNLWRLVILLVIIPIIALTLFSLGGFFTLAVASALLAGLFVPDVRQFLLDTWNANFYRFGG